MITKSRLEYERKVQEAINKLTPEQIRMLNERSYENWFRGMVGGEAKYQEAIRTNSWYNPYSKENYVPD